MARHHLNAFRHTVTQVFDGVGHASSPKMRCPTPPAFIYRSHPAIGVARVGNAPRAFFVGPEIPGTTADPDSSSDNDLADLSGLSDSDTFKDTKGRIKRQA